MKINNQKYPIPDTRYPILTCGFSVIELMVTTAIIAIVSSIVLFNFPSFSSRILLENLTHEIALVVRQAQVYGIGIRAAPGGIFPSYGAHFDIRTEETKKRVLLFADINTNGVYEEGSDATIETFEIQRGNTISGLCYGTLCSEVDTLDITFKRPDPEAIIRVNGIMGENKDAAQITISPPAGSDIGNRYISVWSSGQIAVTKVE